METNQAKKRKILEGIISDPDYCIKAKIRDIDEQVKARNRDRALHAPLTRLEKVLFTHS